MAVHHGILQYFSNCVLAVFLEKGFFLVSVIDLMPANERACFVLAVAQFLLRVCLRVKADLFSGSMTVIGWFCYSIAVF